MTTNGDEVKKLLKLLGDASKGINNVQEGAIGHDGYGFVFKNWNFKYNTRNSGFVHFEPKYEHRDTALYHTGALKTLVPDLELGGDESLFDAWMLVKTPEDEICPLSFYYGVSGLALGASRLKTVKEKEDLPIEFRNAVNCDPFEWDSWQRDRLTTALGRALSKIPTTDFEAVYRHDCGATLMTMKNGVPFMEELSEYDIEHSYKRPSKTWSYDISGCSDSTNFYTKLYDIIIDNTSSETRSENITKAANESSIQLIKWARNAKSRLAYQVLGKYLMYWGADISNELKKEILTNTKWKFERPQLRNKQDRQERKKYLFEFRAQLLAYKNGQSVLLSRMKEPDGRKRQSIDHHIY